MRRTSTTTDLALVSGFAALVAVCAILPSINLTGPVPITLQTFGMLLTGAVLGPRRGFLAVLLYLVVGLAGLPVFAGGGAGAGVLAGPTVGYLVGFPLAAGLCGLLVSLLPPRSRQRNVALVFLACVAGVVLDHATGVAGLVWRVEGLTWSGALATDAPFWVVDLLKAAVAALVATAVHRAFPDLLARRARAREPEAARAS